MMKSRIWIQLLLLTFMFMSLTSSWAFNRKQLYLLSTNNYESFYQPFNEGFIKRQDGIFESIRTADYTSFIRFANANYPEGTCEISESEFKKLVKEMSYFTKRSFRRMHGTPRDITREGVKAFANEARERGVWSLRKLAAVQSELVIYRTYLAKLEGNKNCGWVHVFYDRETLNVKSIFINRSELSRAFALPDPDSSLSIHQGKDFLKPHK